MARRKTWAQLSPNTRQRYISKGAKLGQTPEQVEAYRASGGDMGVYRGHRTQSTYGMSEYRWKTLRKAARESGLQDDLDPGVSITTILESALAKGLGYDWLLRTLRLKLHSRTIFRSAIAKAARKERPLDDFGWNPGRRRWHARNHVADIELFYYH